MAVVVLAVSATLLVLGYRSGYFDATRMQTIRDVMRAARELPAAPALFAISFGLAVILLLPTTAFSVFGGALFGMWGLPLAWVGAMAGSVAAHIIGKYTARGWTRRFLGRHPLLERLRDDASVTDIVRLRVIPAAPFGVLDYLAGMSGIPKRTVLLATGIGILPTMAAYVYAGRQLAIALEGGGSARRAVMIAGGLTLVLVCVAVAPTLAKTFARRKRSDRAN